MSIKRYACSSEGCWEELHWTWLVIRIAIWQNSSMSLPTMKASTNYTLYSSESLLSLDNI